MASLLGATTLAGCSADLGRFDMASASFNADAPRGKSGPIPSEPLRRSNAGGPVGVEAAAPPPPAQPYAYNPAPYSPPASPDPVRQAGLPEPIARGAEPRRGIEPAPRRESVAAARMPSPQPTARPTATGPGIEVQQGDTIYGLAKRHKVSISELMSVNGLEKPMIRPGQKLVLPDSRRPQPPARRKESVAERSKGAPAGPPAAAPSRLAAVPTAPAAAPPIASAPVVAAAPAAAPTTQAEAPAGWGGTHTVTPRDSLYAIAKRYNVKVADLQSANGISDPARLRAGTVLKVPSTGGSEAPAAAAEANPRSEAAAPIARPTIINQGGSAAETQPSAQPERVAVATPRSPVMSDASPAEAAPVAPKQPAVVKPTAGAGSPKFRWPVKGRVIAGFGPRGDNTHNDGINISVPQGTKVHAAESGVVAYAGSELKGYGNLVLIRHEGNWVTAYAHNESLLVKRGDKIERGQPIATAGKTGAVDQPQVHFEVRQGSKPVDPTPYLER